MLETVNKNTRIITNKFGNILIQLDNEIIFPLGILGMEEYKKFTIAPCPIDKFNQFVLLQSLESDQLVFIAFPVDLETQTFYKAEDLKTAMIDNTENYTMLLIAGTKEDENGKKHITVNTQAPIVIDNLKKTAHQCVLQSQDYDVQKVLP